MGRWKNQGKLLQLQKLMVCMFYISFFSESFSLLKVIDCGCTFLQVGCFALLVFIQLDAMSVFLVLNTQEFLEI